MDEPRLEVRWLFTAMLILADEAGTGIVDMTVPRLAARVSMTENQTRMALDALLQPDPNSSSPDEDGRRIVELDPNRPSRGWQIVNWAKYRDIKNKSELHDRQKDASKKYRSKKKDQIDDVNIAARHQSSSLVTNVSGVDSEYEFDSKGVEGVQGEKGGEQPQAAFALSPPAERCFSFAQAWEAWPYKRGKSDAESSYRSQIDSYAEHVALMGAIDNYKLECNLLSREERYMLHGSTFFRKRWKDYVEGVWQAPRVKGDPDGRGMNGRGSAGGAGKAFTPTEDDEFSRGIIRPPEWKRGV